MLLKIYRQPLKKIMYLTTRPRFLAQGQGQCLGYLALGSKAARPSPKLQDKGQKILILIPNFGLGLTTLAFLAVKYVNKALQLW